MFRGDLEVLCACGYLPWDELDGKTVLVTGGTGLIGYTIASALAFRAMTCREKIRVLILARDVIKAREQYVSQLNDGCDLSFVAGSVEAFPPIIEKIDYIVHGASPTTSRSTSSGCSSGSCGRSTM